MRVLRIWVKDFLITLSVYTCALSMMLTTIVASHLWSGVHIKG